MSPAATTPRLSTIVPCVTLTHYGRRCIDALLALDDVEVILVPDRAPEQLPDRVRCIPSGPANTSVKRQLGLEAARAPYVGLIDDDAVPGPGWPEAAIVELERDRTIGAVAGPAITPSDDPLLATLSGRVYASVLVVGPHRWRNAQLHARDVDDAPSVNLVMRRTDAEAIRFDTPWAYGEDTVVCERILARGQRIRYVPGAVVLHSRRPLWSMHLRQVARWSRRRGAFARAGGVNSRQLSYFAPSAMVLGLAGGAATRGRTRSLWRTGVAAYAVACAAAGFDRRPGLWWRLSAAIAATHLVYGIGFLISLIGVPLPEQRER
jgi:Glycosyl transferase family 2